MTTNEKVTKAIEAHLRQWQEMSERMQKLVAPVLKQHEELQRAVQPFLESQAALQKSLEPILSAQKKWHKVILSLELTRRPPPQTTKFEGEAHEGYSGQRS